MDSCEAVALRVVVVRVTVFLGKAVIGRDRHQNGAMESLIASRHCRIKSSDPMVRHVALEKGDLMAKVVVVRAAKALVRHQDRAVPRDAVRKVVVQKVSVARIRIACLIVSMPMATIN